MAIPREKKKFSTISTQASAAATGMTIGMANQMAIVNTRFMKVPNARVGVIDY